MILYKVEDCVVFCKTKEAFGGLSNMAAGYTINMGDTVVRTSEHLYQAFRFTAYPEIQRELIGHASPMRAKMFAKSHKEKTRPDWEDIKVAVMEWCLELKLINNVESFGSLLLSTSDKDIVEFSKKDDFWGALPVDSNHLRGTNALGRLLWALRRKHEIGLALCRKPAIDIPDLLFLGDDAVALAGIAA